MRASRDTWLLIRVGCVEAKVWEPYSAVLALHETISQIDSGKQGK
jgi:hypothetical protein